MRCTTCGADLSSAKSYEYNGSYYCTECYRNILMDPLYDETSFEYTEQDEIVSEIFYGVEEYSDELYFQNAG